MNFEPNLSFFKRRHKVPNVSQMEATECGAACLSMILGYHKNWVPLEQLRKDCHITNSGTSALTLIQVAKNYGLNAKGSQIFLLGLKKSRFPMIILWDYVHYVVLEGVKNNNYYVNDPAGGSHVIPEKEFKKKYSGICLLFEPSPDFKPSNQVPPSNIGVFWKYASKNVREYLFLTLISGLLVFWGLLLPFFTKNIFDDVLSDQTGANLNNSLLIFCVLVFLLGLGMNYFKKNIMIRLEMKITLNEARRVINHLIQLPLKFYRQRYSGDLSRRLITIKDLSFFISSIPVLGFLSLLSIVVYGAAMFSYSPHMSVILFGFTVLYLVTLKNILKKMTARSIKFNNELAQSYGWSSNAITVIDDLQANGSAPFLVEKTAEKINQAILAHNQRSQTSNTIEILSIAVPPIITAFAYAYGGWLFSLEKISIGEILAFQMLALSFFQPIIFITMCANLLANTRSEFNRIDDILEHEKSSYYNDTQAKEQDRIRKKIHALPSNRLSGHIELRDITFGYARNRPPLIKNLSLTIKPKQRVAFVGKSGSGKSTLVQMICGLVTPWSGTIFFDGEKMCHIPKDILAQSLSYVNQDIFMFEGTVRENLSLWNNSITEQSMISALNTACMDQKINALSERLDYRVLPKGNNFSGGERQRLEIARALTNSPSILILDEATSALDPIAEAEVESRLRREGCTCLVVAHRLSTIRNVDQIIVMDQGKIVEQGVHDQLMAAEGFYSKLLTSVEENLL